MKLFISYSHKDEPYKDQLDTHLAVLKRNNVITTWYDRKIVGGENWKDEIDDNLDSSKIVLMLISPDFLASEYCYEKEMKQALQNHVAGESIVIPVIIRPCDWKDTLFSHLQAFPRDAEAVALWSNQDVAWLDIITKLKETISRAQRKMVEVSSQDTLRSNVISKGFSNWLNDTGVVFQHRKVDKVEMKDIFVLPDLKILDDDMDRISRSVNAIDLVVKHKTSLVFGEEQSGKTSLSKFYYKELVESGCAPIYIQGSDIKNVNIDRLIDKKIEEQYSEAFDYSKEKYKAIIIDDFSSNSLNTKFQNLFIEKIKKYFTKIIIFSLDSFQYVAPEIEELDSFNYFEILNFGNHKRAELIKKWVSMGVVEEIDDAELYLEIDEITLKLDTLTRGNLLPAKPIFIITFIQMFEATASHKMELTSYGHCYQHLIYQAFDKAKITGVKIDSYINFLTEFGCAQFNNGGVGLDELNVTGFHKEYEDKYLSINKDVVIKDLVRSNLLIKKNDLLLFKYPYIYYFFTAKKLAESFSNDEAAKLHIQNLLKNLHREDCANIIVFLTHHSKDDWVLDEIQVNLMELFDEYPKAELDNNSLTFMTDFIKEIPELILEHRKVDVEREKRDIDLDKIGKNETDENEKLDSAHILAQINKTFKGIEIIGQIIRNRHGSLTKIKLEELAEQAYGVGLRFLQFFLNISDSSKEEVVKSITHTLKENPNISNDQLEKEAKNIFLLMTYGAIYGVLRKVSMSIGSKEAEQVYRNIEKSTPTPAVKLINQAIYLQFNKTLDIKDVRAIAEDLRKNPVCERMLKEIVIQHIYMFPVDFRLKQKIAETLKIPVEDQIQLGLQKSFNK